MQPERCGAGCAVVGLIPAVALDSSIARMPLPLEAMLFCRPQKSASSFYYYKIG